ncbi:hypothetical protein GCM10010317_078240 [Streptomyces mirabilis]|nr:hypothetical protein GCM10010317_078240 [Streptomyces mirabilis]
MRRSAGAATACAAACAAGVTAALPVAVAVDGWAAATVVVIPASRAAETAATDISFRRTSREGAGRKGLPFVAGSGR